MKIINKLLLDIARLLEKLSKPKHQETREPKPVLWMPDKITAEIRADNVYLKIGKYLHLEQKLAPGQEGWSIAKIEIPDAWTVLDVQFRDGNLILNVKEEGEFYIDACNMGPLSYAILSAGKGKKAPEERLTAIWAEHAVVGEANTSLQPTSDRDAAFLG